MHEPNSVRVQVFLRPVEGRELTVVLYFFGRCSHYVVPRKASNGLRVQRRPDLDRQIAALCRDGAALVAGYENFDPLRHEFTLSVFSQNRFLKTRQAIYLCRISHR